MFEGIFDFDGGDFSAFSGAGMGGAGGSADFGLDILKSAS